MNVPQVNPPIPFLRRWRIVREPDKKEEILEPEHGLWVVGERLVEADYPTVRFEFFSEYEGRWLMHPFDLAREYAGDAALWLSGGPGERSETSAFLRHEIPRAVESAVKKALEQGKLPPPGISPGFS